jgi:hypothetical protein
MRRVDHARNRDAERPAATAQQRHAQRRLISLLNVVHLEVGASGAGMPLTQRSTELPTWLDILGVPYQVTTVRHGAQPRPGPLDVVIVVAWSDLPTLVRWAPSSAGLIEARNSGRPQIRDQ